VDAEFPRIFPKKNGILFLESEILFVNLTHVAR
jgi:hypothetical protein